MAFKSWKYHLTSWSKAIYEKISHIHLWITWYIRAWNFVFWKLELDTIYFAYLNESPFKYYTGCSLMILEKYQIPTLTRKQSVSLKWCHFLPYPSPFWYLVSKKIHNHSVIIHLVRLLRCETVKIWKIHWILK